MSTSDARFTKVPSVLRTALLGAGVALAWAAASAVLGSAPAASAQEALLPSDLNVGSVVGAVVDDVHDVAPAVDILLPDDLVTSIAEPTSSAVDSILATTLDSVPVVGDLATELVGPAPTGSVLVPVATVVDSTLGTTTIPDSDITTGPGVTLDSLATPLAAAADAGRPVREPAADTTALSLTEPAGSVAVAVSTAPAHDGPFPTPVGHAPGSELGTAPSASNSGQPASAVADGVAGRTGTHLARGGVVTPKNQTTPASIAEESDSTPD